MYIEKATPVKAENETLQREEVLERRLEELVTNVTSYIPHELRTPLVSIMGFTEIMMEEMDTLCKEEIKELVQNINRSSKRLYRTVEKFINFVEVESMSKENQMKEAAAGRNLQAHTKTVNVVVSSMAEKKGRGQDIIINVEEAELAIPDNYLKLIAKELCDNALKFSTTGSRIEVTGKKGERTYSIEVKDHGCGITEEEIGQIEPFRQFNRKMRQQGGNGLGLSIVKRIAEVFDCQLSIKSKKDSYTAVTIDFPYRAV